MMKGGYSADKLHVICILLTTRKLNSSSKSTSQERESAYAYIGAFQRKGSYRIAKVADRLPYKQYIAGTGL
jgi:hypothetical protein